MVSTNPKGRRGRRSPRTGVVILNYGDPTDTLNCVRSLEQSTDLDLRLVVADNSAADERHGVLVDQLRDRADVFATGENLGYAGGNNMAIERVFELGCDLVWLVNPDSKAFPGTLQHLRDHLDRTPDCGVVGPRVLREGPYGGRWIFSDGGMVDRSTGVTDHVSFGLRGNAAPKPGAADVDYVTGASVLIRRSTLEQVGLLPTEYFLYYEETDWCLRAQRAGWRVMVDSRARMVHHQASGRHLPAPYYLYYMVRNRYLFAENCLDVDGEQALEHMCSTFVEAWRRQVVEKAPGWLEDFDQIVERAVADALAGASGRCDWITDYPKAEVTHARAG